MGSYTISNHVFLILMHILYAIAKSNVLPQATVTLCHDHERSALLQFKQSLSLNKSASYDPSAYPKTESWKASGEFSSDCCSWYGVECDDTTGYVVGLHLGSSLLYGPLRSNSTIFSLVHLQTLNLADNNFRTSPIPPEIAQLSSLINLNLSLSGFSGQIPPQLSGMSNLTSIDLSTNKFCGGFPVAIFDLPALLVLNVSGNKNLTGFLPEFNQTNSLTALELASTKFSGNLPAAIGNLQSLAKLQLEECLFSGSIPASIGNLTELTYLSLSSNMFTKQGKLIWLDRLIKLTVLSLEDTNLYGDIPPSLANLTRLTTLSLGSNNFSGVIPLWLMNMTQLTTLSLHQNKLAGPIKSSFSQLKNLESLYLHDNNLIGTVEAGIFLSLEKLTSLTLSYNKITLLAHHPVNFTLPKLKMLQLSQCNLSEIPYFLKFQNSLEVLLLRGNNIHGEIPHWIWNASDHLETIDLSANFLTAMKHNPMALQSKSLIVIDISNNMLKGNLPLPPPNTVQYIVSNNRLTGDIPPMICDGKSIKILDLSNNSMSGPLPQCLSSSLEALILQENNFSGTVPQICPSECNLRVMDLSRNQLSGEVPKSLLNCNMLQILDLSNNQMEQTFPNWLGNLPQLQVLLLRSNKFHGAVGSPRIHTEFPMLRIIDLSQNSFTGNLPLEYIKIWNAMKVFRPDIEMYINTEVNFENRRVQWTESFQSSIILTNKGVKRVYIKILNTFTAVDLSSNKFTGKIPEHFGSLEALRLLDLSNNELMGPIPPSLGNLTQLESLDLSHNKLSGFIPQELAAQLNFLEFFNVSYNNLSGPIPQGLQFKTFDNNSYIGNSGLCGFPLSKICGCVQSLAADDDEEEDDNNISDDQFPGGFDWVFILSGLGSGLVTGFVMGNILTDKHPWLIAGIAQKLRGKQKNMKRRKRQIIPDQTMVQENMVEKRGALIALLLDF
nr:PREDICTED: receptor-like protein 12 [Daucus carota subsp. sativus]